MRRRNDDTYFEKCGFHIYDVDILDRIIGKRCVRCGADAINDGNTFWVYIRNDKPYCDQCENKIVKYEQEAKEEEERKKEKEERKRDKQEKWEAKVAKMTSTDEITSKLGAIYNKNECKITGAREFESYPELGVTVYECETITNPYSITRYVVTSKERNIRSTELLDMQYAAMMVELISEMDINLNQHTPEYYRESLKHLKFKFYMSTSGEKFDGIKETVLHYLTYMCPVI